MNTEKSCAFGCFRIATYSRTFVVAHREDILCINSQLSLNKKVQVGKDQEKAQSEKDSHSKKPRWEKTKLTIRYLYHENIS